MKETETNNGMNGEECLRLTVSARPRGSMTTLPVVLRYFYFSPDLRSLMLPLLYYTVYIIYKVSILVGVLS